MEAEESPVPFVETAEVHRSQMDEHSSFKMAVSVGEVAENGKEGFEPQEITNGDEGHQEEKGKFAAQPERMEADESNIFPEGNSHSQSKELPDSTSHEDISETKAKIESTTGGDASVQDHIKEENDEEENNTELIKMGNDKDISRLEEDEQAPDESLEKDGVSMEVEVKNEEGNDESTGKTPSTPKGEGKPSGKADRKVPKPRKTKPKGSDGPTGARNPALCVPAAEVPTPKGWSRIVVQRTTGASAGKYDVYYFSPFGKKLRSKNEVRNYCEQQNLVVDIDMFQFSHSLTPRQRGGKAAGGSAAGQATAKKPKGPAAGKKRKLAEGKNQGGKSNVSGVKGRGGTARGKVVVTKAKATIPKGKVASKKGKAKGGVSNKGKPAQVSKGIKQRAKPSKSNNIRDTKAANRKGKTNKNVRETQTRASKASQKVTVKFTFKAQKRQAGGEGHGNPDKRRK